jgi:hypothetical protein
MKKIKKEEDEEMKKRNFGDGASFDLVNMAKSKKIIIFFLHEDQMVNI